MSGKLELHPTLGNQPMKDEDPYLMTTNEALFGTDEPIKSGTDTDPSESKTKFSCGFKSASSMLKQDSDQSTESIKTKTESKSIDTSHFKSKLSKAFKSAKDIYSASGAAGFKSANDVYSSNTSDDADKSMESPSNSEKNSTKRKSEEMSSSKKSSKKPKKSSSRMLSPTEKVTHYFSSVKREEGGASTGSSGDVILSPSQSRCSSSSSNHSEVVDLTGS